MKIARKGKDERRRIAAVGMWDGVHLGHRFLIDYVRREAHRRQLVPSVVTFDEHPLSVIAPERRPLLLTDNATRLALLDAAGVDDCIMLTFDRRLRCMSAGEFLSMLHDGYGVDALVVGFNNRFGHDRCEGREAYESLGREAGIDVMPAPEYALRGAKVSSSIIRGLLEKGDVKRTARMLGRPFTLSGTVTSGRQIGRQIGFPTANLSIDAAMARPGGGVYAAISRTPDGVRRGAVVNIGVRPTVDDDEAPAVTIEAHILDYAGDIYGSEVTLEFAERLRDERRFADTAALKRQIGRDIRKTRARLKIV